MNLILAHLSKKCIFQDMQLLGKNVKKCTFSRKLLSKTATVVTPNTETTNMTVFAFFRVTTVYENLNKGRFFFDEPFFSNFLLGLGRDKRIIASIFLSPKT